MTEKIITEINARYELKAAADILGVSKSTVLRWTRQGLLKCSIRRSNGRRVWTGAELLRFWRADY